MRPRRWVVERTFGWLMQQRRLVRDYEKTESSAQGLGLYLDDIPSDAQIGSQSMRDRSE